MKRLDPSHQVKVFERNPRGNTFGWGVVFSSQTLTSLAQADPVSHTAITDSFQLWDNVDIVHRGQKVSIRGNRFAGIARLALLEILIERCLELGVELEFGREILELPELSETDLLVGADGVGSRTREVYADAFKPHLEYAANHYIWLGTKRLFHGLTLTFRETPEGLYIAHSYKFSPDLSTFIVECDPESFSRAGFEDLDEAGTLAALQTIFADDLEGHDLLSNHARWIRFVNVRNHNWYHPKVVLLGDALHTAHFSIGSGTKLALEDSIALAECFGKAGSVSDALQDFAVQRKPYVDAYQEIASESRQWFETARERTHLEPIPMAFATMTRNAKVDLENLRQRDPEFVERYLATVS
ncbi:MAG: monooxygenase [Candidatus Eremiobacteraeota bacterium]|nr:monooxygenase [Candidatus Eremiobacteraeota bacterium]